MPKPKKTETPPTPAPLPFSGGTPTVPPAVEPSVVEPPAWVETILAEVRSGIERLKGTIETQVARSGEAAASTEILQRLEAVVAATRVASTSAELAALRGELRSAVAEIRAEVGEIHRVANLGLSSAQSADKYAAEVERRTRPVEPPEAEAFAAPAPRMGIIGFLRALARPEVRAGLGRLVQAAERLGAKDRPALSTGSPVLSLPDKSAD